MTTEFICHVQTPQDDRFTTSDIVTLTYLLDESDSVIRSDARSIPDRGQTALDELIEDGIIRLASKLNKDCFVPAGFPVTVKHNGTRVAIKPS